MHCDGTFLKQWGAITRPPYSTFKLAASAIPEIRGSPKDKHLFKVKLGIPFFSTKHTNKIENSHFCTSEDHDF